MSDRTKSGIGPSKLPETIVSPYRSITQLISLGSKLQNKHTCADALREVQVLQLRGKLPHGVECTALFASLALADIPGANTFVLRNAYALALVRFVNGMLDPFQQGQYASALVNIAKIVGLPLSFVEIRHAATHEELPTLEALRALALKATKWLQDNFWSELNEDVSGESSQGRNSGVAENKAAHGASDGDIVRWLKIFKRGRKRLLDSERLVRPLICDHDQQIYWSAIDSLASECKNNQAKVADILVQHFLVKRIEAKTKTAIKVYLPLVEYLGVEFRWNVLLTLIHQSSLLIPGHFDGCSLVQSEQWLQHLIPVVLQGPFQFGMVKSKDDAIIALRTNLTLLEVESLIRIVVEDLLSGSNKKKFMLPPLLEEILSEQVSTETSTETSTEPEEKVENDYKRRKAACVFGSHDNWTIKPFGVA
ncbi:CIC11C00000002061 [Sungouiella intermedia]|uniref:CIC11C00000002061 n=1 Tax=Sungouiella intermedia TaxID=45354 RepID=A0A1L0C3F0_9ASCO|nr:CIC11C00000002061 [[Candida] intermedia]